MCGRVRFSSDVSEIKLVLSIAPHRPIPNFGPSWPTDQLPIVLFDKRAGERSLDLARWGLLPYWVKDLKVGFANINAKAEEIENRPAFETLFSGAAASCRSITSMSGRRPRWANNPTPSRRQTRG
jgi:putative SOS response-associated peptidase YedK